MQTLSPTVFPCYAPADREAARSIAGFLERCGDVRVFLEEGELRLGQDLAEKAREARLADAVLVLLTRNILPLPPPRSRWEAALIREPAEDGTRIGFVRCGDCVPPRVLVPQFDLNGLPVSGLRQLKRWVRRRVAAFAPPHSMSRGAAAGDLEALGALIADRPGSAPASGSLALEFAYTWREDFDEIFRLECGGRSLAALAGDWAAQLGLRLEGELEQNLERLRDFCSQRRFLLLLERPIGSAARSLIFGGRCSSLIVEDAAPEPSDDPLRRVQFALANIDRAADWTDLCAAARLGRRLCSDQGRLAECYELMEQWHRAAEARSDRGALEESAREMVWILERWDRTEDAQRLEHKRATELAQQMLLPW